NKENKAAQFRTVISLIWDDQEFLFEGICKGKIISEQRGTEGFGYDPIFVPDGANKCFAEMSMDEKNQYSHRKKAMSKLIDFLIQQTKQD
ncbi:MAG: non-canonical purine NTP pyrophosphatase, partial [Sphingobacteriia bacterium 35-36-14]